MINHPSVLTLLIRVSEHLDEKVMCSMTQMGSVRKEQISKSEDNQS